MPGTQRMVSERTEGSLTPKLRPNPPDAAGEMLANVPGVYFALQLAGLTELENHSTTTRQEHPHNMAPSTAEEG